MTDNEDGDINWRRFERMAQRGWGRMARMANDELSNLGNLGGLTGNFRVGRMLASGDLRLVALYLIEQQPRHGYDLIKAVDERSNGVYSPSPGIVYPALTYLEEAGHVTSSVDGNKKLYTITDAGRAYLAENREAVAGTLDFLARTGELMNRFREFVRADWSFGTQATPESGDVPPNWGERGAAPDRPMHDAVPELEAARKTLKEALKKARRGSDEQQKRAAEILRRAAAEVVALGDDEVDL